MKIALAQMNATVGALEANAQKILSFYKKAAAKKADLVVYPEMALTGYPPKDLLEHHDFLRREMEALDAIVAQTKGGPGIVLGYVEPHEETYGRGLYNAAAVIDDGKILSRHYKTLLPTYDVFDEGRYFDSADEVKPAQFRGKRLAITICEDFWSNTLYRSRRLYRNDPVSALGVQGVDFMIHLAASPFSIGKREVKSDMFMAFTRQYGLPIVQVNAVGGNDNLIFDGWSNVWDPEGCIAVQAARFEEDIVFWNSSSKYKGTAPVNMLDSEIDLYKALRLGIHDYCRKCGFKKVAVAISGGIDSAVVAALAVDALGPGNVIGIGMPSDFSSEGSVTDAQQLAENLGIRFEVLPIGNVYETYMGGLSPLFNGSGFGLAEENLQARTRGTIMMTLSNKFGWLVLATGNKSELAVGYCTLYGDMCGGLAVIGDVLKTRVWALARWINHEDERIPQAIIDKPPSAELRPGQFDSDSLPPYDVLDQIIEQYVEHHAAPEVIAEKGFDGELVRNTIAMIDRTEYKRQQAPIALKVTDKAFDMGRRMPVARG